MTSCKMEVHYWDEFNGRMKLWDGVKSLGELVLEYTIVLGASRWSELIAAMEKGFPYEWRENHRGGGYFVETRDGVFICESYLCAEDHSQETTITIPKELIIDSIKEMLMMN